MSFFDAKLRFALLASFRYGNNEPKRSEANQKISKKREAKLRVEVPNYFILTYFLIRLASLQLIISVIKVIKVQRQTFNTSSRIIELKLG